MPLPVHPVHRSAIVVVVSENGPIELEGPLLRMGQFFFGPALSRVQGARDVFALARALRDAGVPVRPSEERLLTQILWCLLQIQHDREETELHQALVLMADLVLAIIEDEDFFIPERARIGGREELELLALQLQRQSFQLDMSLGATIGLYDLGISGPADVTRLQGALPAAKRPPELEGVLNRLLNFMTQGEQLLAGQGDPEKAADHRARLEHARERATFLLARLLTTPAEQDHPVLRAQIVKRELRRIEVDALGIERISSSDQERETRRLLRWTEQDLGVELTDDNKAALAAQLQELARAEQAADEGDWLSQMD